MGVKGDVCIQSEERGDGLGDTAFGTGLVWVLVWMGRARSGPWGTRQGYATPTLPAPVFSFKMASGKKSFTRSGVV